MPIVYVALNKINGKKYIGASRRTVEYRQYHHAFFAKKGGNTIFAKALRKYGKDNFEFISIAELASFEEALALEAALIARIKPEYNIAAGGRGASGVKWTQERRRKTMIGLKASWNAERRSHHSRLLSGKPPSLTALKAAWEVNRKTAKPVICIETGAIFLSAKEASAILNVPIKGIWNVLGGYQSKTRSLSFRWAE